MHYDPLSCITGNFGESIVLTDTQDQEERPATQLDSARTWRSPLTLEKDLPIDELCVRLMTPGAKRCSDVNQEAGAVILPRTDDVIHLV